MFSTAMTTDGCWTVRLFFKESAIDLARQSGPSICDLAGICKHVIVHFCTECLCLPTEGCCIEISYANSVFVRYLKVDYWIHFSLIKEAPMTV